MTRRSLALASILPALALSLVACGGGSTAEPAPVVTVTETVTQTPTTTPSETPSTSPSPGPSTTPPSTASAPPTSKPPTSAPPTSSAPPTPDPVDLGAPPSTYREAAAHIATATATRSAKRFTSPSGNLYCVLKSPYFGAACELGEGGIEDTAYCGNGPASTAIGRVEYDKGEPTAVCNSDTIREPGGKTLAYGTLATYRGASVECLSETIGVTCVDPAAGNGFFIAKNAYLIF